MNTDNTNMKSVLKTSSILSDGKSRIKSDSFNTKNGNPIRLSNDERKALLKQFNPKKKLRNSWIVIATGFLTSFIGAVFSLFICIGNPGVSAGVMAPIFAIPGLCISCYGIYAVTTCPRIEKSFLNAYEFSVDKIYMVQIRKTRYISKYIVNEVISVPADIAEICNIDGSILAKPGIILVCGNNQIKLANSESYGAIRYGLNVGDIIKCAVLESGRYCFITVY